jgi:bisphosphoglycerate-dependent phosphoglycerate mutase
MTAAEWQHTAKYVRENKAKKIAEYKSQGMSDQDIADFFRIFEIMNKHSGAMPGDVRATFLYQFGDNQVKPLKREVF